MPSNGGCPGTNLPPPGIQARRVGRAKFAAALVIATATAVGGAFAASKFPGKFEDFL